MPLTPQITLTATLNDFSGNQIGTAASPAYLRIALCGFGQYLPRIPGTTMVAKIASWPYDLPYQGAQISVPLWGNDVISPAGTYYAISILDGAKNVIQSGGYVLTGTQTVDLSNLSPSFPPPPVNPSITAGLVTIPFSATPVFNCSLIAGPIAFDLTLTGNVISSTLISPYPGQIVTFFIGQNSAGGWTFVWPSNVVNADLINNTPNSESTQTFVARANGNLYPIGPMTYS